MLAPVCSSYVWINRGTSRRCISRPLGNTRKTYIKVANVMVSRVALMLLLMFVQGILVILEQPKGSMLELHPRIQWLAELIGMFRVGISMGEIFQIN